MVTESKNSMTNFIFLFLLLVLGIVFYGVISQAINDVTTTEGIIGTNSSNASIFQEDFTYYWDFENTFTDIVSSKTWGVNGTVLFNSSGQIGTMAGPLTSQPNADDYLFSDGLLSDKDSFCLGIWAKTGDGGDNDGLWSADVLNDLLFSFRTDDPNDRLIYNLMNNNSQNQGFDNSTISLDSNTFYYVSASFKSGSNSSFCIDDICFSKPANTGNTLTYNTDFIGWQTGFTGSRLWDSFIDDFWIIYDRECSVNELQETYNNGAGLGFNDYPSRAITGEVTQTGTTTTVLFIITIVVALFILAVVVLALMKSVRGM